jgi:hypothetical protein
MNSTISWTLYFSWYCTVHVIELFMLLYCSCYCTVHVIVPFMILYYSCYCTVHVFVLFMFIVLYNCMYSTINMNRTITWTVQYHEQYNNSSCYCTIDDIVLFMFIVLFMVLYCTCNCTVLVIVLFMILYCSCNCTVHVIVLFMLTKLPNSEQSFKGKVKTHIYINRQNQSTTGKRWEP